ncbi:hypothetical protein GEMRC1_007308 [Eukaryota sp. GEM-RC1]
MFTFFELNFSPHLFPQLRNINPLRLEFELFTEAAPSITSQFISLCRGVKLNGRFTSYRNCSFWRIVPGYMAFSGDIERNNGSGHVTLDSEKFLQYEDSGKTHDARGLLTTNNQTRSTVDSQFIITLKPCEWLDDRHTVFGRVTAETESNLVWLDKAGALATPLPLDAVTIVNCGIVNHR